MHLVCSIIRNICLYSVPNMLYHLHDCFYRCKTILWWTRVYHTCRHTLYPTCTGYNCPEDEPSGSRHVLVGYILKGKAIPLQAWAGPEGSRRLRLPDFKTDGTRMWQGCQPYAPAAFTPQEIFLVFVYLRSWVDPRAIGRPEELCQWKVPMTPSGIEPATFRLEAQCFNQLRPRIHSRKTKLNLTAVHFVGPHYMIIMHGTINIWS